MLIIIMLAPPASPSDIQVNAKRVELGLNGFISADELALDTGRLKLEVPGAQLKNEPGCKGNRLVLSGGARFTVDSFRGRGETLEFCPAQGRVKISSLHLQGPELVLSARQADLKTGTDKETIRGALKTFSISTCGCADPPWRITGKAAQFELNQGGWVHWPVLRIGDLPIATVPRWYIPIGPRRTGFLLPRLQWHDEDGLDARVPFFWAIGPSVDLTLAPGWRSSVGSSNQVRLRWATRRALKNKLTFDHVAQSGWVRGRGSYEASPFRISVESDASWGPGGRERLTRGIEQRRIIHPLSLLSTTLSGQNAAGGARLTMGQTLEEADSSVTYRNAVQPQVWLNWLPIWNGIEFTMAGDARSIFEPDYDDAHRLGLTMGSRSTLWFGPMRFQPEVRSQTLIHGFPDHDSKSQFQQLTHLKAGFRIAAQRRYPSLVHRLSLSLDGQLTDRIGEPVSDHSPDPQNHAQPTQSITAMVSSRWSTPHASALLRIRERYEYWHQARGFEHLNADLRVRHPWTALYAQSMGSEYLHSHVRLGARKKIHIRAGITHVGAQVERTPMFMRNSDGFVLPIRTDTLSGLSGLVGGTIPLKQLTVSWDGFVDLNQGLLLGQKGIIKWSGRCRCWGARLHISHELERKRPDMMLMLSLGPQRPDEG